MKNKDIRMISEEFLDLKFESEFDMLKSIYYQLSYLITYIELNIETIEDKNQYYKLLESKKKIETIIENVERGFKDYV